MHRRLTLSAKDLDRLTRAAALIEEAQRLLDGADHGFVGAHLQHALDLMHGEAPLRPGSPAALRIDRRFARLAANDALTPD